jgi:small subunit ribosomal protein S1
VTRIPQKYAPGRMVTGKVTKITNFGVFIQLEDELEGLLHVSELADHKVEHPETLVTVGQELEVRVLRVDTNDRKIGLSRKSEVKEAEAAPGDAAAPANTAAAAAAPLAHAKNSKVAPAPALDLSSPSVPPTKKADPASNIARKRIPCPLNPGTQL